MIRAFTAGSLLVAAATQMAAETPILTPPIDCDVAGPCYIQFYVDHDPGPGVVANNCALQSYDGHSGTDFSLPHLAMMDAGIDVIAAAPGVVAGLRDGMPDVKFSEETASALEGRDCGNGVLLRHEAGWETQYCHLKRGSLAVETGQPVERGQVLGQVGLSGRTNFPHVHFTLRKDGQVIDPFAPDGVTACGEPGGQRLWQSALPFRPGGVLDLGFTTKLPSYDAVLAGAAKAAEIPRAAPALVAFFLLYGTQKGDELQMVLEGPTGVIHQQHEVLDRAQTRFFRAIGRKRRGALWPAGEYTGAVTLRRAGQIIAQERGRITLE